MMLILDYGTAVVGTVSGTSISFGTPVVFNASAMNYVDITFDSTNDKVVIGFNTNNSTRAVVGTVSGTSISFGSVVTIYDGGSNQVRIDYDPTNNLVSTVFRASNLANSPGVQILGRVSGTSLTTFPQQIFNPSDGFDYTGQTVNPNTGDFVFSSRKDSSEFRGIASSISITTFPTVNYKNNFIGIAQGNAASGDVVDVRLPGSIDSNNTGLTVGSQYFVDASTSGFTTNPTTASGWDGAVSWGSVGYSVSSSSLILTDML